ncbi:MAG TPA: preprotein translocase subunit SecE [bacterium]|nr:preprotein translocase subunit SecE [bacterium]
MARGSEGATGSLGKPARVQAPERPRSVRAAPRRLPRFIEVSIQFLKDVRAEMNRVSWPDRQTVIASSVVVVFVLTVTALFLGGVDLVFAKLLEPILRSR